MPDLAEQIRDYVEDRITSVTAREVIESTPRSGYVARSASFKRYGVGAVAMVAAIVILITALVLGFRTSSSGSTGVPPVPVDIGATPHGWLPVDYGDLQISVPQTWAMGIPLCNGDMYLVAYSNANRSASNTACSTAGAVDFVRLSNYRACSDTAQSEGACGLVSGRSVANGIGMYRKLNANTWIVPELDASITVFGPVAMQVLRTVTYSPRMDVLARGSAPPIPSSWRRVSFEGISVAVPASWPIKNWSDVICSYRPLFFESSVYLGCENGLWTGIESSRQGPLKELQAKNGLELGPLDESDVANAKRTEVGPCKTVSGLSVCPQFGTGTLPLVVQLPGRKTAVGVVIGLSGSGQIARTIFYSIRRS